MTMPGADKALCTRFGDGRLSGNDCFHRKCHRGDSPHHFFGPTKPLTSHFHEVYRRTVTEWGIEMIDSFKSALARVQTDYDFYIGCQTDPDATLADYDLSSDERAALSDPDLLADVLKTRLRPRNARSITVKISGTHDWVNRTKKPPKKTNAARIQREVAAIGQASTDEERTSAAVRLMELIG